MEAFDADQWSVQQSISVLANALTFLTVASWLPEPGTGGLLSAGIAGRTVLCDAKQTRASSMLRSLTGVSYVGGQLLVSVHCLGACRLAGLRQRGAYSPCVAASMENAVRRGEVSRYTPTPLSGAMPCGTSVRRFVTIMIPSVRE